MFLPIAVLDLEREEAEQLHRPLNLLIIHNQRSGSKSSSADVPL